MLVNKKSHQQKKRIWIIIEFILPIIVGFFNPNLEIGISLGILLWDLLMEEDKHQPETTPYLIDEREESNNQSPITNNQ
ncbi:hypothetical protein NJ959_11740 [Symplocastrum sp. BBK-W-15]|uniref:Uncharacterized protein n=1 Tax=Limnofasciculus baicalensis BBK-W-15 TaxID=2699891 RepID=A0AAE3GRT1_9CYAN|nr:hypothetical protein [Limnofasciculus baicalensis BBK-W-15]